MQLLHPQVLQPSLAKKAKEQDKYKKNERKMRRKKETRDRGEVEKKVKKCTDKSEPQLRTLKLAKLQMC